MESIVGYIYGVNINDVIIMMIIKHLHVKEWIEASHVAINTDREAAKQPEVKLATFLSSLNIHVSPSENYIAMWQ